MKHETISEDYFESSSFKNEQSDLLKLSKFLFSQKKSNLISNDKYINGLEVLNLLIWEYNLNRKTFTLISSQNFGFKKAERISY